MQQFSHIQAIKPYLRGLQSVGKSIGFVPTMGFLHEGHLSLIRRSVAETDITVVSIFVNPIQFGPAEDLDQYPRDLERDLNLIRETGATVVFTPEAPEMYPEDFSTYVNVAKVTDQLCGASRPGHFQGVATVVNKLFQIIRPDKAYFGQKDGQQAVVIQKMVRDLNIDTAIVICPTVREADGLAMSSRNTYLSGAERNQAPVLYQALTAARELIRNGATDALLVKRHMEAMIAAQSLANIEYITLADPCSLQEITRIAGPVMMALAVKFGATRLIDNMVAEG